MMVYDSYNLGVGVVERESLSQAVVVDEREFLEWKWLELFDLSKSKEFVLTFAQPCEIQSVEVFCAKMEVGAFNLDQRYGRFLVYLGLDPCIRYGARNRVKICHRQYVCQKKTE